MLTVALTVCLAILALRCSPFVLVVSEKQHEQGEKCGFSGSIPG